MENGKHCDEKCETNGFCNEHKIEIERRKGMSDLTKNIPKLLTSVNRLIGWSILVMVLVLGSYTWTYIVKQDFDRKFERRTLQLESIKEEVQEFKNLTEDVQKDQKQFIKDMRIHNDRMIRFISAYHQGKLPENLEYYDVAPNLQNH